MGKQTESFFMADDWLGHHEYFHSPEAAEARADEIGGAVAETTPHKVWRVTTPEVATTATVAALSNIEGGKA